MNDTLTQWLFDPTIGKMVATVIGILLLVVLVRFIRNLVGRYVKDTSNRYRARKFVTIIGYLLGIVLISIVYSSKLGGLTVALGVAGAGIAFALQEVIASVAGWMAITLSNFFKTGDRVELGGIKGDVIDIGVLRTTVMECGEWIKGDLYSGRVVRIANSFVFKAPVFNYSGDFPFLWDEITVPVKYGCDHEFAREAFQRVTDEIAGGFIPDARKAWEGMVAQYLIEDAQIEPMVTLVANDNWMEFTIRYVVDYKRRRTVKDKLFSRILNEVNASSGRIALASATFHLVETPVFDVRVVNNDPK